MGAGDLSFFWIGAVTFFEVLAYFETDMSRVWFTFWLFSFFGGSLERVAFPRRIILRFFSLK
jgi:hypothetical protein